MYTTRKFATVLKKRRKKKGGGTCLYIDENIVHNIRNDLTDFNKLDYTESLLIEIDNMTLVLKIYYWYSL